MNTPTVGAASSILCSQPDKANIIQTVSNKVLEIINDSSSKVRDLYTLLSHSDDLKEKMTKKWNDLVKNNAIIEKVESKDEKLCYHGLLAVFEYALAELLNEKKIQNVVGVTFYPKPDTALCLDENCQVEEDSSLAVDKARGDIIDYYLYEGGELDVVYPKKGFSAMDEKQREIYQKTAEIQGYRLKDVELSRDAEASLHGTTYTFEDEEGNVYAFLIKRGESQADDANEKAEFGLWFGLSNQPEVKDRLELLQNFFSQHAYTPVGIFRNPGKKDIGGAGLSV